MNENKVAQNPSFSLARLFFKKPYFCGNSQTGHTYSQGGQCRRHCTDRRPYWIKNVGFPLNLGQLRTYDYRNFTLLTPSGQKFLIKIQIFSVLRNLFGSRMGSKDRTLLKMIKNDPSKPKLMILRKFCFFSENFLKFFPILRWSKHFQRVEIT